MMLYFNMVGWVWCCMWVIFFWCWL